jgi:hypothetical protein
MKFGAPTFRKIHVFRSELACLLHNLGLNSHNSLPFIAENECSWGYHTRMHWTCQNTGIQSWHFPYLPRYDQTNAVAKPFEPHACGFQIWWLCLKIGYTQRTAIFRVKLMINHLHRYTQCLKPHIPAIPPNHNLERSFAPSLVLPRRFPPRATWQNAQALAVVIPDNNCL